MTKIQKTCLWIGVTLFLVPEILFSPTVSFLYAFFASSKNGSYQVIRDNFLHHGGEAVWSKLLLLQFLGLLFTAIILLVARKTIKNQRLFWFGWILLAIVTVAMFFVYSFSTVGISI
jgi:hypothetical protein